MYGWTWTLWANNGKKNTSHLICKLHCTCLLLAICGHSMAWNNENIFKAKYVTNLITAKKIQIYVFIPFLPTYRDNWHKNFNLMKINRSSLKILVKLTDKYSADFWNALMYITVNFLKIKLIILLFSIKHHAYVSFNFMKIVIWGQIIYAWILQNCKDYNNKFEIW